MTRLPSLEYGATALSTSRRCGEAAHRSSQRLDLPGVGPGSGYTPRYLPGCAGIAERRTLVSGSGRSKGQEMIDWDSDHWGNGVTYAANGSWVTDKHGDDDAELD
jgi:hypothetical protein